MWSPWRKSPSRKNTSSNFSCSSFKDIQNLFKGELEQISPKKPNIFHRVCVANAVLRTWSCPLVLPQSHPSLPPLKTTTDSPSPSPPSDPGTPQQLITFPGAEKRIVVYYTSLRVVRKTFEDCRTVRSILRGFRVSTDERDLSMDAGFLEELQAILGSKELITLPRVFIGGRYIGGAEEIRQLNETGELKRFVEGFPAAEVGVCEECGGYRFVLCEECNGSRKCYMEKGGGFRSCSACNENGLIRCPSCSSSSSSPVAGKEGIMKRDSDES
ncbi:uncharacterized protein At5g39865-like [Macadamia integrifolia]|uniref:uncharacterized protein At5g39865-like n=1 Tax=Macadamia integrifolia TaxID=60698 RepID=UPI001C4FA578|nr:uncharacterized protein At5g39865-like [Macadamia integrifolia]